MDARISLSNYISGKLKNTEIKFCIIALFGSATTNWDAANDLDIIVVAQNQHEILMIVKALQLSDYCRKTYGKSVDLFAMSLDAFYKKLVRGDVQILQCISDSYDLFSSGIFGGLGYLQNRGVIRASSSQVIQLLSYCSKVANELALYQYRTSLDAFMHLRTAYRFLMFVVFINSDMPIPRIRDFCNYKELLINVLGSTMVEFYFEFEEYASKSAKDIYQNNIFPSEQDIRYWSQHYINTLTRIGG